MPYFSCAGASADFCACQMNPRDASLTSQRGVYLSYTLHYVQAYCEAMAKLRVHFHLYAPQQGLKILVAIIDPPPGCAAALCHKMCGLKARDVLI